MGRKVNFHNEIVLSLSPRKINSKFFFEKCFGKSNIFHLSSFNLDMLKRSLLKGGFYFKENFEKG